jgi:competence ComEA-like helix-hairpin-helix protein
MNKLLPLLIFFFLTTEKIFCQETDSTYTETNETIENIIENPNEETDDSQLIEEIEDLSNNQIDINKAEVSDLQKIPGMDLSTAKSIIAFREKFGSFFSVQELYSIPDILKEAVDKIIPFVKVEFKNVQKEAVQINEETNTIQGVFNDSRIIMRNRFYQDIQPERGFLENKYLGSRYKSYNRLIIQYSDKIQIGALTDKDPGEKSLNDFSSYHLFARNLGVLSEAAVGDYLLGFGQGLALSSPYGFSKGSDAVYPIKKKVSVLKPYTSSLENNFFRGTAASFSISNFGFTAFYSHNNFDASIDSASGLITSAPLDGYHRTTTEIAKRKTSSETVLGGAVSFDSPNKYRFGLLYYSSKFSNEFYPNSIYDLSGNKFNYTSLYYDLYWKNMNLFGESAYDGTSVATIVGLEISITRSISYISLIRNYPRNYINLHGFGFGEQNGKEQNEVGFYNGIKWRTLLGEINFYYDQFKYPFASFQNPLPAKGEEFLFNLNSRPFTKTQTRISYKLENKDVFESSPNINEGILVKRLRQNIFFEIVYDFTKNLRLKGRFQYNNFQIPALNNYEDGYLVFQDVRFNPLNNLSVYGRISFFNTDSFNSAVYEFENDLMGIFQSLALYGQGIRWYLLMRVKLFDKLTISGKYSETYKPYEKNLGTGYSEIFGNIDNRVSFQIDINI